MPNGEPHKHLVPLPLTLQDASLLFSSASALRPALPYVFLTNDRNYIPAYMLQAVTTPAGVEIAKYFYKPHVDEMTQELTNALALGPAAAEEWSKGLGMRGQDRMKLAENWERWEAKYQGWADRPKTKSVASATPPPAQTTLDETAKSPIQQAPSPIIYAPTPASEYLPAFAAARSGLAFLYPSLVSLDRCLMTPAPIHSYMQSRLSIVSQQHTPQPTPTGNHRGLHDANEAKASRKADIERRCQRMNPPIPANVLRHMDSFRAAIQISQPMNDDAWSVLEPRLVAQLPAAQQAEVEHVSRVPSLPKTSDRRFLDSNSKESKEVMDREWDEAQRPVRDKLSTIADDFISKDWDGGRAVTYESSPQFAVDVLVHVRRIFHAETANESTTSGLGRDENSPSTRLLLPKPKLVLDSMKWVYDNKIKNLTEQYRKELFLCYGAGCEGNTKFYGFEGIVQHYGAKHTNAFSVGNVIVAWREAEWPEETPFHPDPTSVKHAFHSTSGSTVHSGYGGYYGGYSRAGTSTPHMQAHLPQASPGPYRYGGHYPGPFAPPQLSAAALPGYEFNQPYGAPMESYQYQSMAPPGYGSHSGNGYMTSPAMSNIAIAPPPSGPPSGSGVRDTLHRSDDTNHRTSLFDKQVSTVMEVAQDIWKQTSGIKDLPNSLRIYVLLQRVISKFHMEFNYEPSLDHFIDAFSSHEVPRALKNAPGLSCKACQEEYSRHGRQEERKTYTVLNLFLHFRSQHSGPHTPGYINGPLPSSLDWKENMIELPSDRAISGLIHAPGMDDDKLHMVATVFPMLFPTPLPKIGKTDNGEVDSPARSLPKDTKGAASFGGTPGLPRGASGPPSLASPYAGSPNPPNPTDDEYDPQRPSLPSQARISTRTHARRISYRETSPNEYRYRYLGESRQSVGFLQKPSIKVIGADNNVPQQLMGSGRPDFPHNQDYVEYVPSPRRREAVTLHDDNEEREPSYRDGEAYYRSSRDEVVFAQPRTGRFEPEYRHVPRYARYVKDESRHHRFQLRTESETLGPSPVNEKSAADHFLDEFVPNQSTNRPEGPGAPRVGIHQPPSIGQDPEDGSRFTPPPANIIAPGGILDQHRPNIPHRTASSASNGSRNDDHNLSTRRVPTPDSILGLRRPGPYRRRDRYHEHVPARYHRYMGTSRDEPYSRGTSMSRSQSKRYEEQRRRIDQQETPQPGGEQDSTFSRDQSVERVPADDPPYHSRHPPREYVSVQDRLHPYSPPRLRYADSHYDDAPHSDPAPRYIDEYGRPLDDYEVIQVPREPRRASHTSHSHGRYVGYQPDRLQYIPLSYDRSLPGQHESDYDHVYYEGRERHLPPRRPLYEPANAYEVSRTDTTLPQIKVENPPPVPEL